MIDFKKSLRREYKLRSEITGRGEKENTLIGRLLRSDLFAEADAVFLYSSCGTEISTVRIALEADKLHKKTAYPFCENERGEMSFYFSKHDNLKNGMYGIAEPDKNHCQKALDSEKSLCIVPGVAFGKNGERLGRGKGYYDRFLKDFKGNTVALTFEETLCDKIPMEEHDIKIDYIITEEKIYKTW